MPRNWRLLEHEIEQALRHQGLGMDEDINYDKIVVCEDQFIPVNITRLAIDLSERVSVIVGKAKVVHD